MESLFETRDFVSLCGRKGASLQEVSVHIGLDITSSSGAAALQRVIKVLCEHWGFLLVPETNVLLAPLHLVYCSLGVVLGNEPTANELTVLEGLAAARSHGILFSDLSLLQLPGVSYTGLHGMVERLVSAALIVKRIVIPLSAAVLSASAVPAVRCTKRVNKEIC